MNTAVIVCSRNRGASLARLLARLAEQRASPSLFDIIVVDDASDDDTLERVRSLQRTMPYLQLVSVPKRVGLANARNIGVANTSAEKLLFTDDDCVPAFDWVFRMSNMLDQEAIVAGAVSSPTASYMGLCHNVAQFHAFLPCRRGGQVGSIAGASMGIRREVINRLGGFQQTAPHAEDMEFVLRARGQGYRVWFAPQAEVVHDHDRNNFNEVIGYAARHAESTILLRLRYKELLSTPVILRYPLLLLLFSPLIALKVTAEAFLTCWGMLKFWRTIPIFYLTKLAWCFGAANALHRRRGGFSTP